MVYPVFKQTHGCQGCTVSTKRKHFKQPKHMVLEKLWFVVPWFSQKNTWNFPKILNWCIANSNDKRSERLSLSMSKKHRSINKSCQVIWEKSSCIKHVKLEWFYEWRDIWLKVLHQRRQARQQSLSCLYPCSQLFKQMYNRSWTWSSKSQLHFQSLQFEDFSSRPPSPTGGVSWKPIQPVPCFITQSNPMDLNASLEDIVQASNEMPIISTVTFPRSDKKSAAQLGCFDVVPWTTAC